MCKIQIGVIGCGYWGPKLIRNFYELSESDVTMVTDLSLERLNSIEQLYGNIETTQDYRTLLENDKIDAIVIATPISTHYRLAKEALLAGKHVLIEKPMTPSSLEAEELCELAERQGLILMVGHTFEYNPWVEKLRELIQGDVLGEIHYIDSARLNLGLYQRDHNVIWDLAPHDFSIISFLLNGDETERISARGAALVIPNRHDIVHIDGLFSKSIYTNIHVSWLYPLKVRRTTVVGSKKMVVFNDVTDDEKLKIYDKNVFFPQEDGSGQFIDFTPSYFQGDIVIPNVKASEPLKNECKHFLDCIKTGKEARSSGRVGLKVVKMLEKADLTLREQAWQPALVAN